MSWLSDHAEASDIIAEALIGQLECASDDVSKQILLSLSTAYHVAAREMRQAVRDAVTATKCSINHSELVVPKCPACGAGRTR